MKHMGKINAQKGFTLLELLVAVTLIAVGMLATAAMQSVAINANSIANRSTVATAISQEVMADIMSKNGEIDPILRSSPGLAWQYDLDANTAAMTRNITSAGTYRADVVTTHPYIQGGVTYPDVTRVTVTVSRTDDISAKGRSGLAGGAVVLTDFKNVPAT